QIRRIPDLKSSAARSVSWSWRAHSRENGRPLRALEPLRHGEVRQNPPGQSDKPKDVHCAGAALLANLRGLTGRSVIPVLSGWKNGRASDEIVKSRFAYVVPAGTMQSRVCEPSQEATKVTSGTS